MAVQCTEVVSGRYFQDFREEGAGSGVFWAPTQAFGGGRTRPESISSNWASRAGEGVASRYLLCGTVTPYAQWLSFLNWIKLILVFIKCRPEVCGGVSGSEVQSNS